MYIDTVTMMKEDYDKQLELIKESKNIINQLFLEHSSVLPYGLLRKMDLFLYETELILHGKK